MGAVPSLDGDADVAGAVEFADRLLDVLPPLGPLGEVILTDGDGQSPRVIRAEVHPTALDGDPITPVHRLGS